MSSVITAVIYLIVNNSGGDPAGVLVSGQPQDLSKGCPGMVGHPQDFATLIVILVVLGIESTIRR